MGNDYMNLTEIMTVLLNLDYDDTKRIKQLFDSIDAGNFYTRYGSVTEMTQNNELKKLATNLFNYYTAKKGKSEEEFYKNVQILVGALYNNNPQDVKELLLHALSVSDEKKRYDLLKQILVAIKDEKVKNNIYFSIINHSCATLQDYNICLKRWIYGGCVRNQINTIVPNWISKIKQFVLVQDYEPEYFNSVFQEINEILIKMAPRYPNIEKNIRYICQIQPHVNYKQEHFKKVYSGADTVMSNMTKEFLIMCEETKQLKQENLSLKAKKGGQLHLEEKIKDLESENQKLRQTNQHLRTENQKLKQEKHNLKLNLDSVNVLLKKFEEREKKLR